MRPPTAVVCVLLLGACDWNNDCAAYGDDADALGMCLSRVAAGSSPESEQGCGDAGVAARACEAARRQDPAIGAPLEVCDPAGSWRERCRVAWAEARLSSAPVDDLLSACGTHDDCRFQVVDARPAATVSGQLDACHRHAGRFAEDCAVHALQRWIRKGPTADEVDTLAVGTWAPQTVGSWMAAAVSCRGVGACGEQGPRSQFCVAAVADIAARPAICEGLDAP